MFAIPTNKTLRMEFNPALGIYQGKCKFRARTFTIVASLDDPGLEDGLKMEHVSVSLKDRDPTWEEMCFFKSQFWGEEDEVVQVHPKRSSYVNLHRHCLHLWRRSDGKPYLPE